MRAPTIGMVVVAVIGAALVVLLAISAVPRKPGESRARVPGIAAASVSGNGFTLTSASIEPPADTATFPPGAHVDLVNQRCLACHSASMALTQPPLKPEQWTTTVEKMRDVYRAPIEPGEVPMIVDYLSALGRPAPPAAPPAAARER